MIPHSMAMRHLNHRVVELMGLQNNNCWTHIHHFKWKFIGTTFWNKLWGAFGIWGRKELKMGDLTDLIIFMRSQKSTMSRWGIPVSLDVFPLKGLQPTHTAMLSAAAWLTILGTRIGAVGCDAVGHQRSVCLGIHQLGQQSEIRQKLNIRIQHSCESNLSSAAPFELPCPNTHEWAWEQDSTMGPSLFLTTMGGGASARPTHPSKFYV